MAKLPILTAPDPRLKTVSTPVENVDDEIRTLMDDMLETMYAAPGIGLAAIQVGVPKRIIVMDISKTNDEPRFFVNPVIIGSSDDKNTYEEGCLSVPEQFAEVQRPSKVTVKYLDRDGNEQLMHADGLLATCIQHEMDHLEGVLFVDYLSSLRRKMMVKRVQKLVKQAS